MHQFSASSGPGIALSDIANMHAGATQLDSQDIQLLMFAVMDGLGLGIDLTSYTYIPLVATGQFSPHFPFR